MKYLKAIKSFRTHCTRSDWTNGSFWFLVVLLELLAIAFATGQSTESGLQDATFSYYGNLKGSKIVEMYQGECHTFMNRDAEWIMKTRKSSVTLLNPVQFELLLEKCEKNRTSELEPGDPAAGFEDRNDTVPNSPPSLNPLQGFNSSEMDSSTTPPGEGETTSESPLVYPGTKWCGRGDTARSYDDIGLYAHTDKCCRDHDNCFDNIPAGGEKHGLRNNASFTSSHCDCDDDFLNCLTTDDTLSKLTSAKIAHIYFNILKPLCFDERHPTKGCQKTRLTGECVTPEYDFQQPKTWQFFNAQPYIAKIVRGLIETVGSAFGGSEETVDDPTSQSGRKTEAMPPGFSF